MRLPIEMSSAHAGTRPQCTSATGLDPWTDWLKPNGIPNFARHYEKANVLYTDGGDTRTLLSLSNIVLFVVPLMTIVYGTIYLYNSREFIELLLAQPIKRRTLFTGLYLGLAIPLVVVGVWFLVHRVRRHISADSDAREL